MRHRNTKKVLDRNAASRKALVRSLARNMIAHEKIQTTKTRARVLVSFLEPLIRRAREKNVTVTRYLKTRLPYADSVTKLTDVLGPRYANRPGGYMRLIPVGRRKGDAAAVVMIEFV